MYYFLTSFSMHGTCMCVFTSLFVNVMGFSRCESGLIFALPFLESHGVMGLFIWLSLGSVDGFRIW